MGIIVLANENLIEVFEAIRVLNTIFLGDSSSIIDVYFLYRSVMDLEAIKQAVLYMSKIGRFH